MADQASRIEPISPALRELGERGYLEQLSDIHAIDQALASGPVTFYAGYDPTARSLHAGHLLGIMAARILQRHGHRPIMLVGGGTAMVGDPSGKTETRKMLDRSTIAAHGACFERQFSRFLRFGSGRDEAMMLDNAAWLLDLRYIEFLREVGVHFTVNRMIATKTYRERLDNELPLSFLEFNYQLLQAYDFLHLFRTRSCTLQIGGSDQWGNMVAGVELIRRTQGRETGASPASCLTWPLLLTADGKKMGKTERGSVWLDPDLMPPFDYYQYWITCHDRDIERLLRIYTEVPLPEIRELCAAEGAALRPAKARLAFETTRLLHGEEEARRAEAASAQAFGGGEDWSAVPSVELAVSSIRLVDLVVHDRVQAFESKRQARQRIEVGAVRIDGQAVTDPNHELTAELGGPEGVRLQAGKKIRFRIVLNRK